MKSDVPDSEGAFRAVSLKVIQYALDTHLIPECEIHALLGRRYDELEDARERLLVEGPTSLESLETACRTWNILLGYPNKQDVEREHRKLAEFLDMTVSDQRDFLDRMRAFVDAAAAATQEG